MAKWIEVIQNRCKGCGLCVRACPKKIIEISNKMNDKGYFIAKMVKDECIACCMCARTCPDAAIEVFKD